MLIKQPNGMFCFCEWNGSNKKMNLTNQDVIDIYIKMAQEAINSAEHYGVLIERRMVNDEELKEMGFNKPFAELIKRVPCAPVNAKYAHCDFTTYASCPSCGHNVQDGMGYTDEKCRECGQLLKWK